MCACEPSYVCASCRELTRHDDVYADFREPEIVVMYGESDADE